MSILMTLLLIIAITIALLLLAGLFIKKDYALEQRIDVAQPSEVVFDFIRYLKNQDLYNAWWRTDPHAKKEFKGTDGGIGCIAVWDSINKQVGAGEQEIIMLDDGKRIDFEIRFKRPFEGVASTYMITKKIDGGTTVIWGFSGENKYPMNVPFALLGLGKALQKDIYKSLESLKNVLEK